MAIWQNAVRLVDASRACLAKAKHDSRRGVRGPKDAHLRRLTEALARVFSDAGGRPGYGTRRPKGGSQYKASRFTDFAAEAHDYFRARLAERRRDGEKLLPILPKKTTTAFAALLRSRKRRDPPAGQH